MTQQYIIGGPTTSPTFQQPAAPAPPIPAANPSQPAIPQQPSFQATITALQNIVQGLSGLFTALKASLNGTN